MRRTRLERSRPHGKLCGVELEHPTVTTVQVGLIENWTFKWSRLETERLFINFSWPMEDAALIAN
jgi:acetamidase/formamidase